MVGLIYEPGVGTIEIEPVVVTPAARRAGVGHQLVRHVIDVAGQLGEHEVTVRVVGRNVGYFELFHDLRSVSDQPWTDGKMIVASASSPTVRGAGPAHS